MIIKYDGADYPFDMDDITVKQALKIEKFMGCSFADWGKRLREGSDLRARQVIGWLILHQGKDVPIEDTDFKMVALGDAIDAASRAEEAPAPPEDEVPTGAASNGRTPEGSSPASSPPSSEEISR